MAMIKIIQDLHKHVFS